MSDSHVLPTLREGCYIVASRRLYPAFQVKKAFWFLFVYVSVYGGGQKSLRNSGGGGIIETRCVPKRLQLENFVAIIMQQISGLRLRTIPFFRDIVTTFTQK